MFTLDTREKELIAVFQPSGTVEIKALPVGDIWIGVTPQKAVEPQDTTTAATAATAATEEKAEEAVATVTASGGLVIERKTIKDLEASILDGRYREQRGRILAFCHETGAQPVYLIEGSYRRTTGRLPPSTLIKWLNRLQLHYQIPVIHAETFGDTVSWIQGVMEQWKEDPAALQRTTELVKVSDGIHVQKKANASDPRQFFLQCIVQCPGVSVKMGEQLANTFETWEGMMAATKEAIQEVKVGARRIGPAIAGRLYGLLHQGT